MQCSITTMADITRRFAIWGHHPKLAPCPNTSTNNFIVFAFTMVLILVQENQVAKRESSPFIVHPNPFRNKSSSLLD